MATKEKAERKKPGPRHKFVTCTALKNVKGEMELLQETYEIEDAEEAKAMFKSQNKVEAKTVIGPYMKYRIGGASASERISITIKPQDINYSQKKWNAVYAGWNVIAHGLKATGPYKDDECVFLVPVSAVEEGAPRPRFGKAQAIVKRETLEDAKSA